MVKKYAALIVLVILFSTFVTAENCLYFFYGQNCEDCQTTQKYLQQLQIAQPDLQVQEKEIFLSAENKALLQNYYDAYRIPLSSQGLPAVFVGQTYFIGERTIQILLPDYLTQNPTGACPAPASTKTIGVVGDNFPSNVVENISFTLITGSALGDAFNALGLFLILLVILMALHHKEQILRRGLAFTLAAFLIYFLFGLGYWNSLATSSLSVFFYRLLGLVAILFGIVHIILFFWRKKIVSEEKTLQWHTWRERLLSVPGSIIIALLVALLSFRNISAAFLSLRTAGSWTALPLLVYYCVLIMLPLLLATIVLYVIRKKLDIHADRKGDRIQMWMKHHRRVLNVVLSGIIILLGLVLLFS